MEIFSINIFKYLNQKIMIKLIKVLSTYKLEEFLKKP